jgi:hypothetical protein
MLDEHYSPEIAWQPRAREHDVVAVGERSGLLGRADRVHLAAMAAERRAIVTEDVGDFRPLVTEAARQGTTYGLVCVSPRRFPRRRRDIGHLVNALEALLRAHPAEDAAIAAGGELWLTGPG